MPFISRRRGEIAQGVEGRGTGRRAASAGPTYVALPKRRRTAAGGSMPPSRNRRRRRERRAGGRTGAKTLGGAVHCNCFSRAVRHAGAESRGRRCRCRCRMDSWPESRCGYLERWVMKAGGDNVECRKPEMASQRADAHFCATGARASAPRASRAWTWEMVPFCVVSSANSDEVKSGTSARLVSTRRGARTAWRSSHYWQPGQSV